MRRHSSPEAALSAWAPKVSSISASAARALALSSTTSARRSVRIAGRSAPAPPWPSSIPSGTVNVKQLPAPGVLSTEIVPFISSTSWREIDRPRPVPPYRRVVELSAWVKESNRYSSWPAVMPMPVSLTENASMTRPSPAAPGRASTATTISPCSVNLTALPVRLISTWPRRSGSPTSRAGTPGPTRNTSSIPLASVFTPTRFDSWSSISSSENGTASTDILPAAIFEWSRMSLMMPSRCSPAPRILER